MVYVLRRDQIDHGRFRTLAQMLLDKEKGAEAFSNTMKLTFPWHDANRAKEQESARMRLLTEVKKGALTVRPLWEERTKSRLKHRLVAPAGEAEADAGPARSREALNTLYKKLRTTRSR